MALIFLGLLGLIMLLTLSMASWVSREIARPVAALTGFARGYMRNKVLQAPPVARGGALRRTRRVCARLEHEFIG